MSERTLKSALTVRSDCCYCPLSFALDSYWNCEPNCIHCFFRRLNRTWGDDLRPADPDRVRAQLERGKNALYPHSVLAHAMKNQNTIRFGNKTDPFQPAERTHRVSRELLRVLIDLRWTFVIQTRFTETLSEYDDLVHEACALALITVMPVVSPGLDADWVTFELSQTTAPRERLRHLRRWRRAGVPVGINGEPFIPGYHTVEDFEETLKLLKSYRFKSYNTYNLHLNDHNAKRMAEAGIDIERIWHHNQDAQWRPILRQLLDLGTKYGIGIGCPDFVNSGPGYREPANTCCGVNVPRPTLFNSHQWKRLLQAGVSRVDALARTWDSVGSYDEGRTVLFGESDERYTMKDAGMQVNP